MMRKSRAFTLIELMVVIAVVAVIALLAAPSVRDLIEIQRLRGINAQVVTDIQFARSEAARLNRPVGMAFNRNLTMTCYRLYTGNHPQLNPACGCLNAPNPTLCPDTQELRTVQVPLSLNVAVSLLAPQGFRRVDFEFQPDTGAIKLAGSTAQMQETFQVKVERIGGGVLHTQIPPTGRPSVCSPGASVNGVAPCP